MNPPAECQVGTGYEMSGGYRDLTCIYDGRMTNETAGKRVRRVPDAEPSLVKSRKRVADHGEVFTPAWLVEDMLDLVRGESERVDSRFLEPVKIATLRPCGAAMGSGIFILR